MSTESTDAERTPVRDAVIAAALALYSIDVVLPEPQRSLEPEQMRELQNELVRLSRINPESL